MTHHGVKTEMDLFEPEVKQIDIVNSTDEEVRPLNAVTEANPVVEFAIKGSEDYIDPSNLWLYVVCKITKSDGADIDVDAKVGPVNLLLHSLFSQVDVELNERLITTSSNTYPFRAYIETLLNHEYECKDTYLQSELWYKDTPGNFNQVDPAGGNTGLKDRYEWLQRGRECELMGRLHIDIAHQPKLLLPNLDMRIKLRRAHHAFCLMSDDGTEKIVITQASLFVRRVKVSNEIRTQHAQKLQSGVFARYPVTRVDTKIMNIPNGTRNVSLDNVYMGDIPKKLIMAMVSDDALAGSYKNNPFYLYHNNISRVSLNVAGEQIPAKPLTFDFTPTDGFTYLRGYVSLFKDLGLVYRGQGNDIDRNDYQYGYFLLAFDLTPDQADSYKTVTKTGNLSIDLNFKESTDKIALLLFAEFDNVIKIDGRRNVLTDY